MIHPDLERLVFRLKEAGLPTKRFVKLKPDKHPVGESLEWQNDPWDVEDLESWPYWGCGGFGGLVMIDCDSPKLEKAVRGFFPPTFEVQTARRKLTHFYFEVVGGDVGNYVLKQGEEKLGEVRAQNYYLVAPGTSLDYYEKDGKHITGIYRVIEDRPIAVINYEKFMAGITPLLGGPTGQRLTFKNIRDGVGEGERHPMGMKIAAYFIRTLEFDPSTALDELRRWNQKNSPPISDDRDLQRMVKNAVGYAKEDKNGRVFVFTRHGKPRISGSGLDEK